LEFSPSAGNSLDSRACGLQIRATIQRRQPALNTFADRVHPVPRSTATHHGGGSVMSSSRSYTVRATACVVAAIVVLALPATAAAQQETGAIAGRVTDAAGVALPGAQVI